MGETGLSFRKRISTQVVVESSETMGGVLDAGNRIQIPTTQNCDSTSGIYCIVGSKCKKLYVGETGLSYSKRINIHRSDVRIKLPHTLILGAARRPF